MDTSILTEFAATASGVNHHLKQPCAGQMPLAIAANQLLHQMTASAASADQNQLMRSMALISQSTAGQSLHGMSLGNHPQLQFDPLLMAAAALSVQKCAAFGHPFPFGTNSSPFSLNSLLPPTNSIENSITQNSGEGEDGQREAEGPMRQMPTLATLLAAANATSQRHSSADGSALKMAIEEGGGHSPNGPPPAKRSRLSISERGKGNRVAKEDLHHHQDCGGGGRGPSNPPSSLISTLSTAFPLLAAPPPQLPSPVPSAAKSTQNSPVGRRLSAFSTGTTSSSSSSIALGATVRLPKTPQRKPAEPIPAEKKDEAYYERRRKNNDAAKRSRDQRRMKEEITAQRAVFLEQENIQLRNQIALLRTECAKYQAVLLGSGPTAAMAATMIGQSPVTPMKNSSSSSSSTSSSSHVLASPTSTTNFETVPNLCVPIYLLDGTAFG